MYINAVFYSYIKSPFFHILTFMVVSLYSPRDVAVDKMRGRAVLPTNKSL